MKTHQLFLLSASILLASCGGGGGGGGSSSHGVRVLHAAIDLAPADLTSSASPDAVLSSTSFAAQSGYVEVPSGEQSLTVTMRGGAGSASATATIGGGEKWSLLLYEGSSGRSFNVALIQDAIPELGSGQAAIRVVHGVHQAGTLSVSANGNAAGDAAPAHASAYTAVTAGDVHIAAISGSKTLYSGTFTVTAGASYTLLLAGEAGYFVGGRLLQDD